MLCGDLIYVKEQLAKLGYFSCTDPKKSLPKWLGSNNGLMIFSKMVAEQSGSIDYDANKYMPFPKSTINRGFVYAIFTINDDDKILVVNTHFENAIRKSKLGSIKELSNYLANNLADYNAIKYVMTMGDFNICSNWTWQMHIKDKDQRLYSILSKTLKEECGLDFDIFNGFERSYRQTPVDKSATYDHMFINQNLKKLLKHQEIKDWKDNNLVMSDHYGLMDHFSFQK